MNNKFALTTALAFSIANFHLASAQTMEFASPESVGMSSMALEKATEQLQQHIDDGDIAGVVAAVAREGKLVYFESLGLMDLEQSKPMPEDALFRTYSMTRQITSVAVLQLYRVAPGA